MHLPLNEYRNTTAEIPKIPNECHKTSSMPTKLRHTADRKGSHIPQTHIHTTHHNTGRQPIHISDLAQQINVITTLKEYNG